ncbi:MAG: magnesium transporter CorA family protein [Anaerolineae bacterium]|nr:magnesium transporter CorA family protein [Anaerolineae bacterium]
MTIYSLTYNSTTWINLVNPSSQDVAAILRLYPFIHPLNVEDITSNIERAKIDVDDEYLFGVFHFPRWDAKMRLTRPYEVDLFLGRGFIVTSTATEGVSKPLAALYGGAEEEEARRTAILGKGAAHAFYVIVDTLVDYIFPILRKVDQNIHSLEERIFSDEGRVIIRDIAMVRRDIIALRRIIRQLVPVVESLDRNTRQVFRDDLEDYFDDIADHMHRARDIIDEDYEVIEGLADTADKLLSHRINNAMRVLTVISVIMLPLTLISSIYGMNLAALPLSDHPQSFWIISALMLLVAFTMLIYFRFRQWL